MIYARKCQIKEIDEQICNQFLNKYHLQGSVNGQLVMLGIFLKDDLLGVMTFGYPRYNNKVSWELYRLCYKDNIKVVGGSEKLFNYFINLKNPNNIISYCNMDIFDGKIYEQLNFKQITKPRESFKYVKGDKFITESQLIKYGVDNLIGTNYGKGINNESILIENGWGKEHYQTVVAYLWDNEINGIIYKVTNLINNKVYIGQTVGLLEDRWNGHCRSDKSPLDRAIQKYGKNNFIIEEIDRGITYYELNEKEIKYIKKYDSLSHNNGYNIYSGGKHLYIQNIGEETKLKMSLSARKRFQREEEKEKQSFVQKERFKKQEERDKIRKSLIGRKQSEDTRDKKSKSLNGHVAWNRGKKQNEETKIKIGLSKLGKTMSNESKDKIRNTLLLKNKDKHEISICPICNKKFLNYVNGKRHKKYCSQDCFKKRKIDVKD
jgi:group I intron endonuclease